MTITADRTVVINSDFTLELSGEIANEILAIAISSTKKPIYVIINSNGGSVRALRTIISALKVSTCKIVTITTGIALSCGAILFLQGDERIMLPDSELAFHEPRTTCSSFNHKEMIHAFKYSKRNDDFFVDEMAAKLKLSKKAIRSKIAYKTLYLNPEEALKIGAATSIAAKISDI